MKKSSLITILILLVLVIASLFVFKNKRKTSTLNTEASDFAVKDTASIDKIFMADKEGGTLTLTKKNKVWYVDDEHMARYDGVDILLKTIASVSVKSPVSKMARQNVIKTMTAKSTKIEIYSKGEKIKQYYVGHTTQEHTGTYMILTDINTDKNFEEPFITYIRGFEGFLNTRYHTDFLDWRDRGVMDYTPLQLKQIKVDLHEMKDSSFVIDIADTKTFSVKNYSGANLIYDETSLKQYIAYYQNINNEVILSKKDHVVDSLSKQGLPFVTITITDKQNKKNVCELYHKQPIIAKNEQYGKNYKYDVDRIYIKYNDGKDFAIAQFYVFGKLLQTYRYFLPAKTVKK